MMTGMWRASNGIWRNGSCVPDLTDKRITELEQAVSAIGIGNFKEIILQSFMYYLDVDLGFYDLQLVKEKLDSSII